MSDIEDRLSELEHLRLKGAITEDEYQERREAVLDMIAPTPEEAKPKGGFGCSGCLGVVVAVIAVLFIAGVIAAAVKGNSGSTTTSSSSSHQPNATVPLFLGTPPAGSVGMAPHTAAWAADQVRPLTTAAKAALNQGTNWASPFYDLYADHTEAYCTRDHFAGSLILKYGSMKDSDKAASELAGALGAMVNAPDAPGGQVIAANDHEIDWAVTLTGQQYPSTANAVNTPNGWHFMGDPCDDWGIP